MNFEAGAKSGKLLVHGDAAQRGALAGDLLQRTFVGGIGGQPEILPDHQRIVFQREAAQIVPCAAEAAAGEIRVIELVIAHADVHFRNPELARRSKR